MKLLTVLLCTMQILFIVESSQAQKFNKRFAGFSRDKLVYIETEDGKKVEGYLSGLKKEDGLITIAKLKDKTGAKSEFNTTQLKKMYLLPSSYAKIEGVLIKDDEVGSWENESSIDTNLIKEGYVYFEKTLIKIDDKTKKGGKTKEVVLQLVNPHFSKQIKVYDNPNEDGGGLISVGGISVVGGTANSYYIRKSSEKAAYKLYSWDYDEKFADLFGESKDFMEKYGEDPSWIHIERDIYQFTLLTK